MPGLFVSYRRDDSQGFAERLVDELSSALGPDLVFSDVEIPAGHEYPEVLAQAIRDCDALLVVIGRRWAGESTQGLPSRLFEAGDWVRAEIEAALTQRKLLLPVLVGGAAMPAADSLPTSLQALSTRQAAPMSDRHWDEDRALLLETLGRLLPGLRPATAAAPHQVGPAPGPPPRSGPSLAVRLLQPLLRATWRVLRRIVGLLLVVAALYGSLRLFGDAATLRQLDAVDARLQLGWNRLLVYVGRR